MLLVSFRDRHTHFVLEKTTNMRDKILCRIVANKSDAPDADERLSLLRDMVGGQLAIEPLSCRQEEEAYVAADGSRHWVFRRQTDFHYVW